MSTNHYEVQGSIPASPGEVVNASDHYGSHTSWMDSAVRSSAIIDIRKVKKGPSIPGDFQVQCL